MRTLPRPGLSVPLDSTHEDGPVRRRWTRLRQLWIDEPANVAGAIVTFLVVAGTTAFVFVQLQPALLFGPNMDVGGDTAAHVVAVHYLIHDLLPHFQLTGWDPQWFGGFPLYTFYFPLPALIVAVLSVAFPYAVAFKIVTAIGALLMPLAAYAFGQLAGFRRPIPALMCAAMLAFLFNFASTADPSVYVSWNIDGGTIASTMAGEFSFTLALTFSLLFLGAYSYALRTGRLRWLAAALFLATLLCHVVPALFAAGAAVILTAFDGRFRSWKSVLVPVGIVGGLLSAFWLLPFAAYLHYSSSMGYGRVGSDYQNLIPQNGEQAVQWLALVGLVIAVIKFDRFASAVGVMAVGSALAFLYLPSGLVYNGRWLPFWFVTTGLLAGYAVAELGRIISALLGSTAWHPTVTGLVGGGTAIAVIAAWLGVLPFYNTPASERNPVASSWVAFNYSGYQAKPGWHEFSNLVAMLDTVGKEHGCGLLDYEYSPNITNWYGSTLVPMSFPLWTNGCIDTTEGLYYESSTTTPFHFLDQSELSIDPSNPVVGIPYQAFDVADGVRHLQEMGVKYYLANSSAAEQAADSDPSLVKVGSAPASAPDIDGLSSTATTPAGAAWDLYLIKDAPIVAPLAYEPVVESGMSKQAFLTLGIEWYQSEQYWPVPIARTGPASWRRQPDAILVLPKYGVRAPSNTVSRVNTTNDTISFDVSHIGAPVLVKIPYFPNWQASGATGPYEATPNLMVVVPTSHHVTLRYGTTAIDWTGKIASVAGIAGVGILVRSAGGFDAAAGDPDRDGPGDGDSVPSSNGDEDEDGSGDDPDDGRTAPSEVANESSGANDGPRAALDDSTEVNGNSPA